MVGNHQSVVLSVPQPLPTPQLMIFCPGQKNARSTIFLILDGIESPQFRVRLRTDAAGVHGIIIPKRRAVQLATVAKISTGAIEYGRRSCACDKFGEYG